MNGFQSYYAERRIQTYNSIFCMISFPQKQKTDHFLLIEYKGKVYISKWHEGTFWNVSRFD